MLYGKTVSGKGLQQVSWVLGEGYFRYKSNVNRGFVVGFWGFLVFFLIFVIYFFPKTVSLLDVVNTDFLYGPELQLDLR